MIQIPLNRAKTFEKRGFYLLGVVSLEDGNWAIMAHYREGIA